MANSITQIELRIDSNFGSAEYTAVAELRFRNSSGTLLSTAGWSATSSNHYAGYDAGKCLDGDLTFSAGSWSSDGATSPTYILTFTPPSAVDVATVEIVNHDSTTYANQNAQAVVLTATHTVGGTTSVSATRPSSSAGATTTHTIPALSITGQFSATSPAPSMDAQGYYQVTGELSATTPAPTLSVVGVVAHFGRLAATAPAPTFLAFGIATNYGRLAATSPSPTLIAAGTIENTTISVLDSASSQDGLVTSVVGNYNLLDSSTTDDAPTIGVVSTYDLLDAHTTEDGIAIVLELTILDAATHETVLTREVSITAEVMESSRSEDGFTAWRVVEVEVFDAANNVDGVAVVWEVDLLDAVQHADLLSVTVDSTADVLDVAQALSEALGNALVELVLLDQSTTQELFQYEAIRNAEILDSALAQTMLGTDGGKAFYTYALNTLLNAGSRYGNHNFNSYAATDTACYAAGEGGVFLLEGDDDAGYTIPAGFRTSVTDLRTEAAPEGARPRSVQYAYLGMTSSGELRLKASAANGGAADTRTYRVRQTGDTFDNTTRVVMGKGVQARYWQFTIENTHGEAFDVDQIELLPVARTRRI